MQNPKVQLGSTPAETQSGLTALRRGLQLLAQLLTLEEQTGEGGVYSHRMEASEMDSRPEKVSTALDAQSRFEKEWEGERETLKQGHWVISEM